MELHEIEILLEKYFEAITRTEEEKRLKAYFSGPDVVAHLEQYRAMFGYFANEAARQYDKPIPLKPKRRKKVAWLSAAAGFVVLSGLFTLMTGQPAKAGDLGTYDDPEVAFRETQKALNMLSGNINVGVSGVGYLGEYERTKDRIFKDKHHHQNNDQKKKTK